MNEFHAQVTVDLPDTLTLRGLVDLGERIRETALPLLDRDRMRLTIQWSAENEWDLRGAVETTMEAIESEFPEFRGISDWVESETEPMILRWQGEAKPVA